MILAIVRALLRFQLGRLGRRTRGPFDPDLSGRIDRCLAALELLEATP